MVTSAMVSCLPCSRSGDGDRVADAGDTDLIDRQVPVDRGGLDVLQHQAASPR